MVLLTRALIIFCVLLFKLPISGQTLSLGFRRQLPPALDAGCALSFNQEPCIHPALVARLAPFAWAPGEEALTEVPLDATGAVAARSLFAGAPRSDHGVVVAEFSSDSRERAPYFGYSWQGRTEEGVELLWVSGPSSCSGLLFVTIEISDEGPLVRRLGAYDLEGRSRHHVKRREGAVHIDADNGLHAARVEIPCGALSWAPPSSLSAIAAYGPALRTAVERVWWGRDETVANVELLIEAGADLEMRDDEGETPLLWAVQRMDGDHMAALLLEKGADPAADGQDGLQVAAWAVEAGHAKTLKALIAKGLDLNSLDESGHTLLMQVRDSAMAKLLLDGGADPCVTNLKGRCALHVLATHSPERAVEVIKVLLDAGADINQADVFGLTPLTMAVWSFHGGAEEMALFFLQAGAVPTQSAYAEAVDQRFSHLITALVNGGIDVDEKDEFGQTALSRVAGGLDMIRTAGDLNSEETALLLLSLGANPFVMCSAARTLLHEAAYAGQSQLVQALLDAGLSIDAEDEEGRTPLMVALNSDYGADAALVLLARGARLECGSISPLLEACARGKVELACALLEQGAELEQCDGSGNTPLLCAAGSRAGEACALSLLRYGANSHGVDAKGRSALHLAALNEHGQLARALVECGVDPELRDEMGATCLHYTSAGADTQLIETLLSAGLSIDQCDGEGYTPLSYAARAESRKALLLLLERGANPRHVAADGKTALHLVSARCSETCARALLQHGALIDQPDAEGRTALMLAADRMCGQGRCVRVLIEAGANVHLRDKSGRSAISYARESCKGSVVEALLGRGALVPEREAALFEEDWKRGEYVRLTY